jgi:Tfp pilus assembly protein PilF
MKTRIDVSLPQRRDSRVKLAVRGLMRYAVWAALAGSLAGCASHPATKPAAAAAEPAEIADAAITHETVMRALRQGDAQAARDIAQRLVLADPRNGRSHLLLAAAYHLSADPAALDLASSGYGAARQISANDVWANYLAGVAAMQTQRSPQALDYFAAAVMAQPDHLWALEGLAGAAYASGDVGLAQAAANRALANHPDSVPAWRVAALSHAAMGNGDAVDELMRHAPRDLPVKLAQFVRERSRDLVRTVAVDQLAQGGTAPTAAPTETPPITNPASQMSVDVTLILADDRSSSANGINLLDGLQLQFGQERKLTRSRSDTSNPSFSSALTRSIRIPDISYNLNIFNRGARYYEVIARPTLTAFNGQQSTFFVGEQLFVQVAGVNTAALEKIDVGVSVKLTPSEITAQGAKFKIEADRSFFSDQGIGSFKEQLATFKQSVSATAEVKFGETLLLSGLSEKLRDGNSSRTPVLGDIPGPNALFKRSTLVERTRSVLVLVTPVPALGVPRTSDRSGVVQRLIELWDQVIEPNHGGAPLVKRLQGRRLFTRPAAGDVALRDLREREVMDAFLLAMNGRSAI